MAAQGDVDAFLRQVDETITHFNFDAQPWIAAGQYRQARGELALHHRNRSTDSHGAAGFGLAVADNGLGGLDLGQRCACALEELLTDLGQCEAARTALQQPHLELFFQQRHALAQGRARQAQMAPACSEPALLHRGHEQG